LRPHKGLHPHLEALKQKSRIESKRGDDAGLLSLGRDLRYSKKVGAAFGGLDHVLRRKSRVLRTSP
jgi:hypothetical protein